MLPRPQYDGMCALYAFLRHSDDLADAEEPVAVRRENLRQWRIAVEAALGGSPEHPLLAALADTARRFHIPFGLLLAALDGVAMDLEEVRCPDFASLHAYCYHVASVVGLACIHIWGFRGDAAWEPAIDCGVALQLTNILRDVPEDARQGRIYLPADELADAGIAPARLVGPATPRLRRFILRQVARADAYYGRGDALPPWLSPLGQRMYWTLVGGYRALLAEIERRDGDVWSERVSISPWTKAWLGVASLMTPLTRPRRERRR